MFLADPYKEAKRGSAEWHRLYAHGTHVAGIVAGSNLCLGVAPETKLKCYAVEYKKKDEGTQCNEGQVQMVSVSLVPRNVVPDKAVCTAARALIKPRASQRD